MGKRLKFALESLPIMTLITNIRIMEYGGLDLRPKYQRNYIWKNDFKDKLIYSIIKSYPIGTIIIRQLGSANEKGAKSEIVDGQQRLTTIFDFIEGRYEIHSEISRKIIEEIQRFYGERTDIELEKLKKRLKNKGNIRIRYSELPSVIKGNFDAFNISVTNIVDATDYEITEYFRYLQNQERLRAGEILNSLVYSKLERYLDQIQDIEAFCKIIGFFDNRKEFEKLFYNIIGVMDNKISLGAPDNTIEKYVTTVDEIGDGKLEVNRLLSQINKITNEYKDIKIINNVKKRYVKFLMLLMGFGLVDFTKDTENKLQNLKRLDNKLSVFFSTKPDIVKKEFECYSNEIIEEFRSIALISKGAQTTERVKNRMKILAYYIENADEKDKASGIEIL